MNTLELVCSCCGWRRQFLGHGMFPSCDSCKTVECKCLRQDFPARMEIHNAPAQLSMGYSYTLTREYDASEFMSDQPCSAGQAYQFGDATIIHHGSCSAEQDDLSSFVDGLMLDFPPANQESVVHTYWVP